MQSLLPVQYPLSVYILLQGYAVDKLHNDIVEVIRVVNVVNGDYIRMRKHSYRLALRVEPAAQVLVLREISLEYLYGYEAV